MLRISLELDRTSVARLGDDAAASGALATRRGVIVGDSGHGLVRRDQIRNELFNFLRSTAEHRRGGSADAEDFEKLASLHAGRRVQRCCCVTIWRSFHRQ